MEKKSLIITILICIVISIIGGVVITLKKEPIDLDSYDVKDANVTCYYEGESTDEDDVSTGKYYNYMYIYNNKDNIVTKVIYKSVYENNFFNDSLASLTNSILDLYSDVDGITTSIDTVNKKTVVSIEYDYTKIDIEKAQEELKELLSDEAVLMNMEDEITVEEYLDLEDSDYICK